MQKHGECVADVFWEIKETLCTYAHSQWWERESLVYSPLFRLYLNCKHWCWIVWIWASRPHSCWRSIEDCILLAPYFKTGSQILIQSSHGPLPRAEFTLTALCFCLWWSYFCCLPSLCRVFLKDLLGSIKDTFCQMLSMQLSSQGWFYTLGTLGNV